MNTPARFKAGDFVLSRNGKRLKVVRSIPVVELFGLMAGEHKGYKYLLENDQGKSITLPEGQLREIEHPMQTSSHIQIKSESGSKVDKSIDAPFDDGEDDDLLKALASITELNNTATRVDAGGSCPQNEPPNKEEDIIREFHHNDEESDDDFLDAVNNIDEYYFKKNTKPLPTKRKCFEFSPIKQDMRPMGPPSKTLKLQSAERISSLKSSPASSRPNQVTSSSIFLTSTPVVTSSRSSTPPSLSICSLRSPFSKSVVNSVDTPSVPNSSSPPAMTLSSLHSPSPILSSSNSSLPTPSVLSISSSRSSPSTSIVTSASTLSVTNSSSPSAMTLSSSASNIKSSLPTLTTSNESSLAPPDDQVDENVVPPKRFLTKEERKLKLQLTYDPKDSDRKSIAIAETFVSYIKLRGESRDLSALSAEELSEMLSSFWAERRKEDGGIHDVSTLHSEFARLAAYLKRVTGLNPTTHPEFEEYRKTKASKLKQSKQVPGNGQKRHQSDALDSEEISHFFDIGLINTGSGIGIVRMMFTTFMIVLNSRALKDHLTLKMGNLKIVKNKEGLIEYAYFVSQFGKTNDGFKQGVTRRGIIPPSATRNTCFFTYWKEYLRQIETYLGPEFLEPDSPLYLQPKLDGFNYNRAKNHCKFYPEPLKECLMKDILKNMCIAGDIDASERKLTNTTLRISSFHGQENLGIDSQTGQSISGHSSNETCAIYRRKNQTRMHAVGAGLMSQMSGVPAVVPLTHGQLFALKKRQQITTVDTSSTLQDFTPQLMSLQRAQKTGSFKPGDKYPAAQPFVPKYLKLDGDAIGASVGDQGHDVSQMQIFLLKHQAQLHSLLSEHHIEMQHLIAQHPTDLKDLLVQQNAEILGHLAQNSAQLQALVASALSPQNQTATSESFPQNESAASESSPQNQFAVAETSTIDLQFTSLNQTGAPESSPPYQIVALESFPPNQIVAMESSSPNQIVAMESSSPNQIVAMESSSPNQIVTMESSSPNQIVAMESSSPNQNVAMESSSLATETTPQKETAASESSPLNQTVSFLPVITSMNLKDVELAEQTEVTIDDKLEKEPPTENLWDTFQYLTAEPLKHDARVSKPVMLDTVACEYNQTKPKESTYNSTGFQIGELVFAKVRGHRDPHWPAQVTSLNNSTYTVNFFGTTQAAIFSHEASEEGLLVGYSVESHKKYGNPKHLRPDKKKAFALGLENISKQSSNPSPKLELNTKPVLMEISLNRENIGKLSISKKRKKSKLLKENNRDANDLDDFQL